MLVPRNVTMTWEANYKVGAGISQRDYGGLIQGLAIRFKKFCWCLAVGGHYPISYRLTSMVENLQIVFYPYLKYFELT